MATPRTIICGICEAQYITKHAEQWCTECDEDLCSNCENKFHKISKATRDHDVISIENYHKLPSPENKGVILYVFAIFHSICYFMSCELSLFSTQYKLHVVLILRSDICCISRGIVLFS
jgi:hypothetical protein